MTTISELNLADIACSSSLGAPCQLLLLAGPEHGRTIPLAVIGRIEIPRCSESGSHPVVGRPLFFRRLMRAASSETTVVMSRPQERRYSSRRLHPRQNQPLPAR